jgi:hypothetical protein
MPPGEVANVVLDAIKEERFYVLPHPQFKTMVRDRLERILDERNPDVGAPAALARPGQQATRP